MSRRSRARRKLARKNYRSSRETPRAIAAQKSETVRTYPKASELLASGHGWREFLETTLRSVLRPVAIVGAVGLAGCGAQSHATVSGDPKPSGAVLVPMSPPGGGTTTQNGQQVITGALPPPQGGGTPVVQNGGTPPIHHPPSGIIHGAPPVVPIPTPVQVRGEMTSVTPIPPMPEPVPLGGAPMPTRLDPVQPPTPVVPPPTPPTPPPTPPTPTASPNPEPIPMPGGMAAVMPDAPVRSA